MDITWSAIFKVVSAGLGTYVLLPAFLVLRDFILWKCINKFILNSKAQQNVREYVQEKDKWNNKHAVKKTVSSSGSETSYHIDKTQVFQQEFEGSIEDATATLSKLRDLEKDLNFRARLVKWLVKHYKQDASDPINQWVKEEIERVEIRKQKS